MKKVASIPGFASPALARLIDQRQFWHKVQKRRAAITPPPCIDAA